MRLPSSSSGTTPGLSETGKRVETREGIRRGLQMLGEEVVLWRNARDRERIRTPSEDKGGGRGEGKERGSEVRIRYRMTGDFEFPCPRE